MKLGGIIDISTKDIPNKSCMVLFTVGCNFKCEFCHNKYLLQPNVGKEYEVKDLVDKIKTNALVSGVSITGGEPTLQNDLVDLCKEIRKQTENYLSIDTNGSNPELIGKITPYINRVALDLKGPLIQETYRKIIKTNVDISKIIQTINLLNQNKDIDFEIRTTYVLNLLEPDDIERIINFLHDSNFKGNYVLQQFQYREEVGERFKKAFLKPEHDILLKILEQYKNLELPFKLFLRDDIIGYCEIDKL
ncbi:MAG: anaerobic ribonucleoside-triphosphate reductase activating protein [Candidatus Thorarchaeota archaeon]